MGIPGLYGKWIRKRIPSAILTKLDFRPDSLLIDFNAIIHQSISSVKIDHKINTLFFEDLLIEKLKIKIKSIVANYRPKKTLLISIDGIAPFAKMKQQRIRRSNNFPDKDSSFNRSAISPGTIFMKKLEREITSFIKEERNIFPDNIIFSPSSARGEGEQKIFKYLKSRKDLFPSEGKHLIHGLDADLIILSLFSGIKNLFLLREEENETNFLNIDLLSHYLKGVKKEDFVLINSLIGNDFLPRMLTFSFLEEGIEDLISLLKKFKEKINLDLTFYDSRTKRHIVDINNLFSFLKFLSEDEERMLKRLYHVKFRYPSRFIEETRNEEDIEKLRVLYYNHAINLYWLENEKSRKIFQMLYEKETLVDEVRMKHMVKEYIRGIIWIFNYYQNISLVDEKEFNLVWFYPYFHCPLLKEIVKYFELEKKEEYDISFLEKGMFKKFSDKETLVSIIPYHSKEVTPIELDVYYDEIFPFGDLIPIEFNIEKDATYFEHESIVLIPFFNRKRLEVFIN